jgi:hypothetical protein
MLARLISRRRPALIFRLSTVEVGLQFTEVQAGHAERSNETRRNLGSGDDECQPPGSAHCAPTALTGATIGEIREFVWPGGATGAVA